MSDLRTHLQSAKQSHLATKYPGNLALDILAPNRTTIRPIWWIAPIAAAALVAIVLFTQRTSPTTPGASSIEDPSTIAKIEDTTDDTLFALNDVPTMQTDMGIAPAADESTLPSFSEITVPTMPSFDSTDQTSESTGST